MNGRDEMGAYPFECLLLHVHVRGREKSNLSQTEKLVQKGYGEVWAAANNPFQRGGGSGGELVSLSLSLSIHLHGGSRRHGRQRKPFLLQLPSRRQVPPTTPQRSEHPFCLCRHRQSHLHRVSVYTLFSLSCFSFLSKANHNTSKFKFENPSNFLHPCSSMIMEKCI